MRDAVRWVCAVVTYTLVLWVVFLFAIVTVMGDPVAGREGGFHFGNPDLQVHGGGMSSRRVRPGWGGLNIM